MPTRKSSFYDKKQKYVTMDFCSENISEGMLERLDDWSQFDDFQQGCFDLITIFSAWENSKCIRQNPERWSWLKDPNQFQFKQTQELERRTKAVDKLNTLISQMQLETEKNWEAIDRDGYFKKVQESEPKTD